MNKSLARWGGTSLAVICVSTNSCFAQASVEVSARCNIYGAGRINPPAGVAGQPGILPVAAPLDLTGGAMVVFDIVRGSVDFNLGGVVDADGNQSEERGRDTLAYGGISGILSVKRSFFLTGVFLSAGEPADPAPSRLIFSAYDFSTLEPELGQLFFIGDGRGTEGSKQQFRIPPGASRLFLGFVDNGSDGLPGYYDDNSGALQVTVNTLPAGTTVDSNVTIQRAVAVSVPTSIGRRYQLQKSQDLVLWSDFGSKVLGNGEAHLEYDITGDATNRFYRAVSSPE
jgi:hypothetical protein